MQIQIRGNGPEVSPDMVEHVERRLNFSLGRFAGGIRSVAVSLSSAGNRDDEPDQECTITIQTGWKTRIRIEGHALDIREAVIHAASRAGRTMERHSRLMLHEGIVVPTQDF